MRVLIAENQSKVRFALRVTLERQPGLSSVCEVVDAEELLSQAEAIHPDLVLLDWDLDGIDRQCTVKMLRRVSPHLFIIALCSKEEALAAARQAGADACISKGDAPERLLSAIGDFWKKKEARP